jgi:hypothetical protein
LRQNPNEPQKKNWLASSGEHLGEYWTVSRASVMSV